MFGFAPPTGPDDPFGSYGLIIVDSIRVLIMGIGVLILTMTPAAVFRSQTLGQKVRLGASALLTISVLGTEIAHLGDYAHWRLFVNVVAISFSAWGIWAMFKWENPSEFKAR